MPASTVERLGFDPHERVVIFHADDLGMCHAANAAFVDILAAGAVRCGSIMVPCPWFNEIAAIALNDPEADLGVHVTLTSEWPLFRWGPLSTRDPASGLIDEEGYLWRDLASLHARVQPEAAAKEMRAQVEKALAAGIDVTHVDTHMGAVAHPALVQAYISLALEFRVPAMLPRLTREQLEARQVPPKMVDLMLRTLAEVEESGEILLIDHVTDLYHRRGTADDFDRYRHLAASLPPGLTHLIYHPSRPDPEAVAILGEERAVVRAGDWEVFADPAFKEVIEEAGVRSIGYRELRDVMRS